MSVPMVLACFPVGMLGALGVHGLVWWRQSAAGRRRTVVDGQDADVIDTADAIVLEDSVVTLTAPLRDGVADLSVPAVSLEITGRTNRTRRRTRIRLLCDLDGAAALASGVLTLGSRTGFGPALLENVERRMAGVHAGLRRGSTLD